MLSAKPRMSTPAPPSVSQLLNELSPLLDGTVRGSIGGVGHYGCALRAAVAKSLEFTRSVWIDPPPSDSFFRTATLRGICENFIVLAFIGQLSPEDQNRAIALLMEANLVAGLEAQKNFFQQQRPWQPVLPPAALSPTVDREDQLRALSAQLGWTGRQTWPSVWFMAKRCSEEPLYRYLYSASSKWVHFSPHLLLRMGWGGSADDLNDNTEWHFTTAHFVRYYTELNQTYALFLLLRILRGPASSLVSTESSGILDRLLERLDEQLRWPETVTFEEMNLVAPGPIQRILLRAGHSSSASSVDRAEEDRP